MRIPTVAEPVHRDVSGARIIEGGISASWCLPCGSGGFGKKICCSWSGCSRKNCCHPCIPIINKRYCGGQGWVPC